MTIDHKYQVPTVAVHTDIFQRAVTSVARVNGMPKMRQVYVPQPVMGKSAAELRAYIDGNDPITGRPVMQEIIEGLTQPLDHEARSGVGFDRSTPRLVDPDTEENLNQLFLDQNWTDKLPIVLPTEERVAAMLKHTSHKPDEVVGHLRPTNFREFWEYTVEKVAVNAVMAGCKPEYFPVVLALAASGSSARGSTTSSAPAMAVVNGPIRHELGMNCGIGAMGPYNHANATIGRAWGLLSQNGQGGSTPGLTYLGSQGNNYAYTCICYGENEEAARSRRCTCSTDSRRPTARSARSAAATRRSSRSGFARSTGRSTSATCSRHGPAPVAVLVLDPITARQFVDRGGLDTREKVIEWVYENARMPAGEYWDYQLIQNYVYRAPPTARSRMPPS
jgi:hypothetical protein